MKKNQKSSTNGIQNFLCPFTDMYITQGCETGTHKDTKANDVRGKIKGIKYPYYAPCDVKMIWYDLTNGEAMYQSVNKVRFSNKNINYATFVTAHDNKLKPTNKVIKQGELLGYMGDKAGNGGSVSGVHCHIEIAQHKYTIKDWHKNKYGIWCFSDETDTDNCYFVNDTNILNFKNANWKKLPKEKVDQILHKGSKVQITGTYTVKDINVKDNTAKINIAGKDYWISSVPLKEV